MNHAASSWVALVCGLSSHTVRAQATGSHIIHVSRGHCVSALERFELGVGGRLRWQGCGIMRAAHSWEDPAHDWEDDGAPCASESDSDSVGWGGDYSESEDEDAEPRSPAQNFIDEMVVYVMNRTLNARQLCTLMRLAAEGGMAECKKYGFRAGAPSGHYNRHLKSVLGLSADASKFYQLTIPAHLKASMSRSMFCLPVVPPHEALAKELEEDAALRVRLREQVDDRDLPPCYYAHPVVEKAAGELVLPIALYIDAVPYSLVDSVLGFWVINLTSSKRHLFCVLRKRLACKCGCRGWCSFHAVFDFIAWSLRALANGAYPALRHDGRAWGGVGQCARRVGWPTVSLEVRAALPQGRLVRVLLYSGIPKLDGWLAPLFRLLLRPRHDVRLWWRSALGLPWHENSERDYFEACARCDHRVLLNQAIHRLISQALKYDKRKGGSRGRALAYDVPAANLLAGDRLEPSPVLRDVSLFEDLDLPATVTFWRCADETLTRHRNPVFDETIGVTPSRTLIVDTLHALYLGVFNSYCRVAIWFLLTRSIWGSLGTTEEHLEVAVLCMKSDLMTFYKQRHRRRPTENLTRLSDLTRKMVGTRDKPKLGTKGAETFGLVIFVVETLRKHHAAVGAEGLRLLDAGVALNRMVDIFAQHGPIIPAMARQAWGLSESRAVCKNRCKLYWSDHMRLMCLRCVVLWLSLDLFVLFAGAACACGDCLSATQASVQGVCRGNASNVNCRKLRSSSMCTSDIWL